VLSRGEGEDQVGELLLGRLSPGDDLERAVSGHAIVARLHQEAARQRAEREARRFRVGQASGQKQPQILLPGDDGLRFVAGVGRDDDFGEDLDDLPRGLCLEAAVHRHDAAKGAGRIAG